MNRSEARKRLAERQLELAEIQRSRLTDGDINAMAARSRLMRELDRRDAERRKRKPPEAGIPAVPVSPKPLLPSTAVEEK